MTAHSTAVLTDPGFEGHDTGPHPEQPARMAAIRAELTRRDLLERIGRRSRSDPPTGIWSSGSTTRAISASSMKLRRRVGRGSIRIRCARPIRSMSPISRPEQPCGESRRCWRVTFLGLSHSCGRPGITRRADRAMGFCLINSIAVAAQAALDQGLERVAIVDWDVHHGNGTEAIFEARNDVLFCSVHQFGHGFFPGTGDEFDAGVGAGAGYTVNAPLRPGADNRTYDAVFREQFGPKIEAYRAGADHHFGRVRCPRRRSAREHGGDRGGFRRDDPARTGLGRSVRRRPRCRRAGRRIRQAGPRALGGSRP